jgi:hypothetical protein
MGSSTATFGDATGAGGDAFTGAAFEIPSAVVTGAGPVAGAGACDCAQVLSGLLGLIPFVGAILLLVFMAQRSKPEGQRFDKPTW